MIFNCGLTWEEKFKLKQQWHRWFAWYPVRTGDHECRWLEYIEQQLIIRRYPSHRTITLWEYRSIGEN